MSRGNLEKSFPGRFSPYTPWVPPIVTIRRPPPPTNFKIAISTFASVAYMSSAILTIFNIAQYYWQQRAYRQALSNASSEVVQGCLSGLDSGSANQIQTREVFLECFATYTGSKSCFLRPWTWTTHWAVRVGGTYNELCYRRHRYQFIQWGSEEREQRYPIERRTARITTLMGVTHMSDEQLHHFGNAHAMRYRYSYSVFTNNCQNFLHEAFFGAPVFSLFDLHASGLTQEIRCRMHGKLRNMPPFTSVVAWALMTTVYLITIGFEAACQMDMWDTWRHSREKSFVLGFAVLSWSHFVLPKVLAYGANMLRWK